jgi:hypothetical protein
MGYYSFEAIRTSFDEAVKGIIKARADRVVVRYSLPDADLVFYEAFKSGEKEPVFALDRRCASDVERSLLHLVTHAETLRGALMQKGVNTSDREDLEGDDVFGNEVMFRIVKN